MLNHPATQYMPIMCLLWIILETSNMYKHYSLFKIRLESPTKHHFTLHIIVIREVCIALELGDISTHPVQLHIHFYSGHGHGIASGILSRYLTFKDISLFIYAGAVDWYP